MPNPRRLRLQERKLEDSALGTPPGASSRKRTLRSAPPPPAPGAPSRKRTLRSAPPSPAPNARRRLATKEPETRKLLLRSSIDAGNETHDVEEDGGIIGENIEVVNGSSVVVTTKRKWTTCIECPCTAKSCKALIRVGKYGDKGSGEPGCVHCGRGKEKNSWNSIAELKRHVQSDACRKKQGVIFRKRKTPKEILGRRLCHDIDNLDNLFEERVGRGSLTRQRFKCPHCSKETNWNERFAHSVKCRGMA